MRRVKAAIRRFHSPDVPDPAGYQPDHPDVFGVLVQVLAGPSDGPGEESFDVVVCSPRWFEAQLEVGEVRSARHHLMALRYNWPAIEDAICEFVERCEASSWSELAQRLEILGRWEFEDYTP